MSEALYLDSVRGNEVRESHVRTKRVDPIWNLERAPPASFSRAERRRRSKTQVQSHHASSIHDHTPFHPLSQSLVTYTTIPFPSLDAGAFFELPL